MATDKQRRNQGRSSNRQLEERPWEWGWQTSRVCHQNMNSLISSHYPSFYLAIHPSTPTTIPWYNPPSIDQSVNPKTNKKIYQATLLHLTSLFPSLSLHSSFPRLESSRCVLRTPIHSSARCVCRSLQLFDVAVFQPRKKRRKSKERDRGKIIIRREPPSGTG